MDFIFNWDNIKPANSLLLLGVENLLPQNALNKNTTTLQHPLFTFQTKYAANCAILSFGGLLPGLPRPLPGLPPLNARGLAVAAARRRSTSLAKRSEQKTQPVDSEAPSGSLVFSGRYSTVTSWAPHSSQMDSSTVTFWASSNS